MGYIRFPIEKGPKLIIVADYEMPWGIVGRILEPLIFYRVMEKEFERDLRNLKSFLEK